MRIWNSCPFAGAFAGDASWPFGSEQFERNAQLKTYVGPRVNFIDPMMALCPGQKCIFLEKAQPLFFDYGHFSTLGSRVSVEKYFPFFRD